MKLQNNFFWLKFNALCHYFLVYGFSGLVPYYIVNEYPKSGGSWLSQMVASALDIPFPRDRLPMLRPSIMHGHYLYPGTLKNTVVLWRDGRDVVVSQYYHWLFKSNFDGYLWKKCRADLKFKNYEDIKTNLPAFIDYVFVHKKHPKFSWSDFVNSWADKKNVVHVKYEDLKIDAKGELIRIVHELTGKDLDSKKAEEIVERFSFEKLTGRKCGEENHSNFLRKGIVGDWRNKFTEESIEKFKKYAGKELIRLGYEKDDRW